MRETEPRNRLEEENGKRTLLLDYSEFIVGIYETMPHWAPRDGEPINKKLRKRLSAVKLATHTGLGAKRKDYEQVPVGARPIHCYHPSPRIH